MRPVSLSAHLLKSIKRWDLLLLFTAYFFLFETLTQGDRGMLALPMSLLIKPFVLSFILHALLRDLHPGATGKTSPWTHVLPFLGIEFTARTFLVILFIALSAILATSFPVMRDGTALFYCLGITSSLVMAVMFFWYAARSSSVRNFLGSLNQALRTIRAYPLLYVWAAFVLTADILATSSPSSLAQVRSPLSILGTSVLFSLLFLQTYRAALAATLEATGQVPGATIPAEVLPQETSETTKEEKLATASLILGLFSFVPLVHFGALFLGHKIFFKQKVGRVRSLIGLLLGAFCTALYALLAIGLITLPKSEGLAHITTLERLASEDGASQDLKDALTALRANDPYKALDIAGNSWMPEDEGRVFALGIASVMIGDPDTADTMLKKCLTFPGHNGEAYYHLGLSAMGSHERYTDATGYFDTFLRRFPGDPRAQAKMKLIDNSIPWKDNIFRRIGLILILLLSFTIHELAHAYTAHRCGDTTQKASGRLSLNPLRHIDPFGSIILPGILLIQNSDLIFGWAKPVMVDKSQFREPEKDNRFVAASGSLANLALGMTAMVLLLLIGLILSRVAPGARFFNFLSPFSATAVTGVPFAAFWAGTAMALKELVVLSLVLCFFNLLPVPPLDGSWILETILPPRMRPAFANLRKYSIVFILLLVLTPALSFLLGIPLSLFLGFSVGIIGASIGLV